MCRTGYTAQMSDSDTATADPYLAALEPDAREDSAVPRSAHEASTSDSEDEPVPATGETPVAEIEHEVRAPDYMQSTVRELKILLRNRLKGDLSPGGRAYASGLPNAVARDRWRKAKVAEALLDLDRLSPVQRLYGGAVRTAAGPPRAAVRAAAAEQAEEADDWHDAPNYAATLDAQTLGRSMAEFNCLLGVAAESISKASSGFTGVELDGVNAAMRDPAAYNASVQIMTQIAEEEGGSGLVQVAANPYLRYAALMSCVLAPCIKKTTVAA